MKYARTSNGFIIHVSKAWRGYKFYCPECGEEVIVRRGKTNKWHFAHKKNQTCVGNDVFVYEPHENQPSYPTFTSEQIISREETKFKLGYEEVKDLFVQQDEPIYDFSGVRWIKCEICGEIKPKDSFYDYGGKNRYNLGVCKDCSSKS